MQLLLLIRGYQTNRYTGSLSVMVCSGPALRNVHGCPTLGVMNTGTSQFKWLLQPTIYIHRYLHPHGSLFLNDRTFKTFSPYQHSYGICMLVVRVHPRTQFYTVYPQPWQYYWNSCLSVGIKKHYFYACKAIFAASFDSSSSPIGLEKTTLWQNKNS